MKPPTSMLGGKTVITQAPPAPEQVKTQTKAIAKRFKPAATEEGKANPRCVPTQQQPAVGTTTGEAGPPALAEHARLDLALRQAASRVKEHFLAFTALAAEVIDKQVWTKFGYRSEREYFDERIGVAWRTVTKYLRVHRAIENLPQRQKDAVRQQLSELGIEKASVLAPAIEQIAEKRVDRAQHDRECQALVEQAASVSREALQEQVSQRLGLKPRGREAPKDRAESLLLNDCLPPELKPWAESIWRGIQKQLESRNVPATVITLFRCAEVELAAVGVSVTPPATDGPFAGLFDNIDFALRRPR